MDKDTKGMDKNIEGTGEGIQGILDSILHELMTMNILTSIRMFNRIKLSSEEAEFVKEIASIPFDDEDTEDQST
ncbi:hypothetical protein [Candidatus Cryosericum septentrionale]|jgi:hypothetical protein|uniref:Uncharacterized protein n=1 Tax=Candidatus Cryosericum septentrionale TaxID=2290913 RepID=A0A398DMP1_9BACT|nr:hypothetical protein [Candidatus Cryosericum septentrionale]RIE16946.1 hypothetical protein SMC1_03840 [Candidatus Cryosericum septentrionale]